MVVGKFHKASRFEADISDGILKILVARDAGKTKGLRAVQPAGKIRRGTSLARIDGNLGSAPDRIAIRCIGRCKHRQMEGVFFDEILSGCRAVGLLGPVSGQNTGRGPLQG